MSKIEIGDEMIENQLINKSNKLNISMGVLINRYIRRGLFMDNYYVAPERTLEELLERSKKDVEKDMENGIFPKKHDFGAFINRWSNLED